jgi:hypothetical protein
MNRKLPFAALILLINSCVTQRPAPVQQANPGITRAAGPFESYAIDGAASELRLFVYRAGAMAALGHNHVIVDRQLCGIVRLGADFAGSGFDFIVPVGGFSVDEPAQRREAGEDFASEVSDSARSGTLRNMLSPALLDSAGYPVVHIQSLAVSEAGGKSSVTASIQVKAFRAVVTIPFTLEKRPDSLVASGEISLQQSALGLTPFSVMLGALAVRDEFRARFKIVAHKADSPLSNNCVPSGAISAAPRQRNAAA